MRRDFEFVQNFKSLNSKTEESREAVINIPTKKSAQNETCNSKFIIPRFQFRSWVSEFFEQKENRLHFEKFSERNVMFQIF